MSDLLKRVMVGIGIGFAVALIIGIGTQKILFFKQLLDGYEYLSYDSRMKAKVAGAQEASIDSVVIIDIEQMSVAPPEEGGLGNYKDWPHAYHGQLIDVVSSGDPKALLFDIIFDRENTSTYDLVNGLVSKAGNSEQLLTGEIQQYLTRHDPKRFVEATYRSQKTYHALVFEKEDTLNFLYRMDSEPEGYDYTRHIIRGIPIEKARRLPVGDRIGNTYFELLSASVGAGSANFPQDEDGIIRRAPTAIFFEGPEHVYPSLTMAAIINILGIKKDGGFDYDFENHVLRLIDTTDTVVREIPIDDHGRMYVNYFGPFKTFYYLPYMYCFDPEMLPPEYWKDRVAFVGASLPGLMDLRNTPVQETFAGVEIHANVMYSILQNKFIRPTDAKTNLWVIFLVCLIGGGLVSLPPKPLYTLLIPVFGIIGWVIFTYSQFLSHLIMWEVVRPALAIAGTYLGIFLYNFLVVEKDKRFLKNTFGTYISPELIDQIYEEKQEPKLGGDSGVKTAYFTDIQSFSSFSEILTATQLVELLNEYLTAMTDVLLEQSGTLDKYEGDAIVAFFGAPLPMEDHAYRACLTALGMQKELAALREKWAQEGSKWPDLVYQMRMRIGINSGDIVTGNMGSKTRMNYTMMGDVVNTAARLEASAKQYGIYIQMTKETLRLAGPDQLEVREIDRVRVVGKSEAVESFELMGLKGDLTPQQEEMRGIYYEGLQLYREQRWGEAKAKFAQSDQLEEMFANRPTNPSRVYMDRCDFFKKNPPGDDWDGVWTLTSK
jgi:adenylate cyclase